MTTTVVLKRLRFEIECFKKVVNTFEEFIFDPKELERVKQRLRDAAFEDWYEWAFWFPEDMEKYAFRAILSCRGSKWAYLQNMALLLEDEEQEIIDLRANGSLSPFYLSYFSGMEPSSPFYTNYKEILLLKHLSCGW